MGYINSDCPPSGALQRPSQHLHLQDMKLVQSLRRFLDTTFRERPRCEAFSHLARTHPSRPRTSNIMASGTRSHHTSEKQRVPRIACTSRHYVPAKPIYAKDDFQAQLIAFRDQAWWNGSVEQNEELDRNIPTKRSLSIREIRERMNSDQRSISSTSTVSEFEPGLRLIEGRYGSWEDMEMFAD